MKKKILSGLEFVTLFFGIPLVIYFDRDFIHPIMIILPVLVFIGGVYFARVYQQTRSVLFTSVLHGLMGIIIFGVGLGQYFWLDIPV